MRREARPSFIFRLDVTGSSGIRLTDWRHPPIMDAYSWQDKEGMQVKKCMDADNLHRRLKKIIGQVQAIDRMVDEDVPCEDILAQINAAKSALHKVGQVVNKRLN